MYVRIDIDQNDALKIAVIKMNAKNRLNGIAHKYTIQSIVIEAIELWLTQQNNTKK